ncbi:hypothetical protein COC69_05765 [Bacillus cereus]|uniref:Fibronectin type-III domain-containing protein n=1 Tax=Bacillus cereus TaxID=1396 RepID=A0A9X7CR39_BACCE|nr:hypothetical protein [Bacillus cereus]PGS81637.1 hypothetical protein COC69_05765 [Bacillus cereus]
MTLKTPTLTGELNSEGYPVLTWSDESASGATTYLLQRFDEGQEPETSENIYMGADLTFTDAAVTLGQTYNYFAVSYDGEHYSEPSEFFTLQTTSPAKITVD